MAVSPLGVPMKGERKVGRLKQPEVGSEKANRTIHTVFIELNTSKGHSSQLRSLKEDAGGSQIMKPTPVRNVSVTILRLP